MYNFLNKLIIIIIIVILLLAFSSSYATLNIANLAVVVAMGIDASDNNNFRMIFQYTSPSSISENGTSEKSPSIIYTVEASSITSGINLMNSYIGKQLTLSHCKLIVFSEEIAQKGISEEIYTLINNAQIRPSTNIVVSKCSAKYYIENSRPILEHLLTKYYEEFSNSSKYTGFTSDATIGDFFNDMICETCEPYAILGGLTSETSINTTSINSQKDSSSKSNESAFEGETETENTGLAVFKQDTLAGELNKIETLSFLATRNLIDGFNISVPNPKDGSGDIDIRIFKVDNCDVDVKIINGSPYIKLKYKFKGRIYSINSGEEVSNSKFLEEVSSSCNNYLQSTFSNYLYKTSKELKADINQFGKKASSNFLTSDDFTSYNWNEAYKDSFFDVSVDTNIISGSLISET